MVLWAGSVVSLLYEAIYSNVSCARLEERVRESFGAYDCLLRIILLSSNIGYVSVTKYIQRNV